MTDGSAEPRTCALFTSTRSRSSAERERRAGGKGEKKERQKKTQENNMGPCCLGSYPGFFNIFFFFFFNFSKSAQRPVPLACTGAGC